jgi:hypothetical protein
VTDRVLIDTGPMVAIFSEAEGWPRPGATRSYSTRAAGRGFSDQALPIALASTLW